MLLDAPIDPADPLSYPDAVRSWSTFTCTFIGLNTVTIPVEAWDAVLATNPTRIQTRVLRLGAKTNAVPGHDVNLVAGQGYAGLTDVP